MVESQDARALPSEGAGDGTSADALYRQGMAYYRRRQWQQARESFRNLKKLDPGRRGIDALLNELDIFIRLESFAPHALAEDLPQAAESPQPRAAARRRAPWLMPATLGAIVLVSLVYGMVSPRLDQRVARLRQLGRGGVAARQWPQAINAYEELLLLMPEDGEARQGLWMAYYERGDQRAAEAMMLEESGRFQEAARAWEQSSADFGAALQVQPSPELPDPRGEASARLAVCREHQRGASLLALALRLRAERRWSDAIQALQRLGRELPGFRSDEVRGHLSETCLAAGQELISTAETAVQLRQGVALLEKAVEAQPSARQAVTSLEWARSYLQAATSFEAADWDGAIEGLGALIAQAPGYADGRAIGMLCRAYTRRAGERLAMGELDLALADYQAVASLRCSQWTEAEQQAAAIAKALTPTATPTPVPPPTPTSAPGSPPSPGPQADTG